MTVSETSTPAAFPEAGRRIIFYLLWDPRGIVDDYVVHKLEKLRGFAEHIFVVVNGKLTPEGRSRLSEVADTVWQRENRGFDVEGYRAGLAEFGEDRLSEYDELILMNYTWFGPINPFEPLFERMDAEEVDFWGLTDHARVEPNPFTGEGVLPRHIQSHWIAVRRRMFQSEQWRRYWREMPAITSYSDSILQHESVFTDRFARDGFSFLVAYPSSDFSSENASMFDGRALLDAGCPMLKRRPFFHDPLFLDRNTVVPRHYLDAAIERGYPVEMIWQNLTRSSQPKVLSTNAAMMRVLPDVDTGYDTEHPLRVAVAMHIFYTDLTAELLAHAARLPGSFDLFITTSDETKAAEIRAHVAEQHDPARGAVEVRVTPSNRGRDMGAFFVGCRDVLTPGRYDIVFKLHSKKTVQDGFTVGEFFRWQQMSNLLNSPGYAANLLALFQREPGLGVVFPPMVHTGFPTLGRAWFTNWGPAAEMCEKLGISVPFDDPSPLAPFGGMFAFRPEALRRITQVDWTYEDFPAPSSNADGDLSHVLERLPAYAAAEDGYHTRTTANLEYAEISHTALEYKLDRVTRTLPGYANEQSGLFDRTGSFLEGGLLGFVKAYLRLHRPNLVPSLYRVYSPVRGVYRSLRSLRHRARRVRTVPVAQEPRVDEMEIL
ncbi:rhamnan synthesis F family protein [Microbacterium sp. NPDC089189]|uniref:rhamnan synthesis F family protein n=1 Tax=Microbacterium sp. NPDC089189 TaxID=3154972 RepID=UPI00342981E2